jgi:hypothetical protein
LFKLNLLTRPGLHTAQFFNFFPFYFLLFKDHPENDNEETDQEHKDGNPVDRIHVTDPTVRWLIRIPFPDIQIFGQFA